MPEQHHEPAESGEREQASAGAEGSPGEPVAATEESSADPGSGRPEPATEPTASPEPAPGAAPPVATAPGVPGRRGLALGAAVAAAVLAGVAGFGLGRATADPDPEPISGDAIAEHHGDHPGPWEHRRPRLDHDRFGPGGSRGGWDEPQAPGS